MLAASRNRKGNLNEIISEELGEQQRTRALVVEANPCDLTNARITLRDQGYFFLDTALSLKQAFELIKTHTYQMILIDYNLPDGDGIELMNWMDDECCVLMLSGHVMQNRLSTRAAITQSRQMALEACAV